MYANLCQVEGGKALYPDLKQALDEGKTIVLDFIDDPLITSGFLNESIGRLVLERGRFQVQVKDGDYYCKCHNGNPLYLLIEQVIANAHRQRDTAPESPPSPPDPSPASQAGV